MVDTRSGDDQLKQMLADNRCVMFSIQQCGWCDRAEELFGKLGRQCRRIMMDRPENARMSKSVVQHTQMMTVPNIFIDNMHIGGYDRLLQAQAQCASGKMDPNDPSQTVCEFLKEAK
mmetsp:Transcript_17242/g.43869  ORF Transcript_17242/g.43869 Transcript_17242/m.43869 type:complete len:117 (-) Transcript_17242:13-363(-)